MNYYFCIVRNTLCTGHWPRRKQRNNNNDRRRVVERVSEIQRIGIITQTNSPVWLLLLVNIIKRKFNESFLSGRNGKERKRWNERENEDDG